ncbi:ABC transporter ATP-binding protein [Paenibacillus humicus]|uniref:ABC transporter ATP-binding protein n=1 Tax=Paenibacillus humicus TaxID=412861 RepID=UPI000FD7035F|nr:ABC transporter ATP-binding protein [Paenibacillus humicus]
MEAVIVEGVTKTFRIYKERASTLKERLIRKDRNRFDLFLALDDVSLTINKGSTVGLMGRNGSGKSTLLKLLTGILYPDKGKVEMKGKVSSLLELGAGFHPDFTGRENIYMNASILGLSKREIKRKLNDIILFSELGKYIENPVKNYSSGMYMRLAFSIAIMVEPDILLIDEVLAVGDAAFQQKCMDQLIKLKTNGTTIVFVSHDLGAMEKLCDRVIWLNQGKVLADGKPKKTIDQYLAFLANEENKRLIYEQESVPEEMILPQDVSSNEEDVSPIVPDVRDESRWGDRSVEIMDVVIMDKDRQLKKSFISNEVLKINIKYKVNRTVKKPIFGIGIFTMDHINCYGTNTYIDQYEIDLLSENNTGDMIITIPALHLGSGTYLLSVAVHDEHGNQYDYHDKKYSFKVSSLSNETGIVKLTPEWELSSFKG